MKKVLIVDDEEAIRFVFHRFLTDAGYDVSLAAHENDVKNIISVYEFDVAIVDRILSDGKNGLDLIKEIRRAQPSCEVIVVSGVPSFHDTPGLSDGAPFVYLTKPVRKDDIIRAVEEAEEKRTTKKASYPGA